MNELLSGILVGMPQGVENLRLPDPNLRDYYRDEEERIFWLNCEVEVCAEDLIKMILRCNKEDKGIPIESRKPIKIFIDSPGGDVIFMNSIISVMGISKTPIYTINYCTAYSAASLILAAGHKRYALPGSHVLLHNGYCSYSGEVGQVESTKKYFDALSKKTTDWLLGKTKIDSKTYKKKASKDWYLKEHEALENGIINKIVTDLDEIF